MFPAKQSTGEKTSGDFWKTEFPHTRGKTLRRVAETEIWKQQQRQQPKVYFLTNYKIRMIHNNLYPTQITRKKVGEKCWWKKLGMKNKLSKIFFSRSAKYAQDKNLFY